MGIEVIRPAAVAGLAALGLAACAPHVERVTMDTGRINAGSQQVAPAKLACPVHLAGVVDARSAGDRAGGLGKRLFILQDAPDLVRRQLLGLGLTEAPAPGALEVSVRILKLYLDSAGVTKIPVVVYEARVGEQPPFLIRAQQATMNWASTENEAYAAYARSFQAANAQLVARLQRECAKRG